MIKIKGSKVDKKFEMEQSLDWYDGPLAMEATDKSGSTFIGLIVDTVDALAGPKDRWLFFKVTPEFKRKLYCDKIPMRDSILQSSEVYITEECKSGIEVWQVLNQDIPKDYLPQVGAKMDLTTEVMKELLARTEKENEKLKEQLKSSPKT